MMLLGFLLLLFAVPAPPSGLPVGLLLSEGAEVSRNAAPYAPAAPGELLYPGDHITARKPVRVLSCRDKLMSTIPAGGAAAVELHGVVADRWESRTPVKACFLPAVNKGPVGGPRHLGAMMIRSLDAAETGTRESRINALSEPTRAALRKDPSALEGVEPELYVMRGVLFQRHRLHTDARTEYEAALKLWPRAVWLKTLMIAAADAALRSR
jgi:hypothetical protein